MKKRLLSILLAACLLVGLLPTVAFAGEAVTFTAIEGTAGANDDETYSKLVDGNTNTKWCVPDFNSDNGAYIIIKASAAMQITGYSITTGNDNEDTHGRNPKAWTLYGSTGTEAPAQSSDSWEEIASVSNDNVLKDLNYATYNFYLTESTEKSYQYFKLEISATQGSEVMQMSEFTLTSCEHSWGDPVVTNPTCTTKGYQSSVCTICGNEKTENEVLPLGHDFSGEDGACTGCGKTSAELYTFDVSQGRVTITDDEFSGRLLVRYADGQYERYVDPDQVITVIGSTTQHELHVGATTPVTIKVKDLVINRAGTEWAYAMSLDAATANVTLILEGENKIAGGSSRPGISVGEEAKLTIEGSGSLEATGGYSAAGIGGSVRGGCGTIIINSGNVTARGYNGIGAGYESTKHGTLSGSGGAWITATNVKSNTDNFSGVINNQVYGNAVLKEDRTISEEDSLTIPEGTTLTIPEGVTLTVNGTLINNGTVTGDGCISPDDKKLPQSETPSAPTVQSVTANSITLDTMSDGVNGVEYSMDGTNWQDSETFDSLTANTRYTFYARYAGNGIYQPSGSSDVTTASTANAMTLVLEDSYGDGWNGAQLLIYRDGLLWKTLTLEKDFSETVELPYSDDSVYSFFWQKGDFDGEVGLTVTVPGIEAPVFYQPSLDVYFTDIEDGTLLFQLNAGDYSAVNAAIAGIPADLSVYTPESVQALRDTVNAVNWCLKPSQQSEINAMADAITDAISALVTDPNADAQGRISMTTATADLYITETGYRWGAEGDETSYTGAYRLVGTSDEYRVIVESGSHQITFYELNLTNADFSPFTIQPGASVSLMLLGENELKNIDDTTEDGGLCAGLNVPAGAALEITKQSTGSLLAHSQYDGAGIGGNDSEYAGSITISGGSITARSGDDGAGIGSGGNAKGSSDSTATVTITGGTVNAQSCYGAGIGSGYDSDGDTAVSVTITGGTVNARSYYGAGIGSSDESSGEITVTISGGTVNAQSHDGAGIGSGDYSSGNGSIDTCTVIISGGNVTGQSVYGAGIGSGDDSSGDSTVTITGGIVTAQSQIGAGIGSGEETSGDSTVTISGGIVKAQSQDGVGIGCGENSSGYSTVTISGGIVKAVGGSSVYSCGIYAYDLTIKGGTVKATGGSAEISSAGIVAENQVTITGGTVKAAGGSAQQLSCGVYVQPNDAVDNPLVISGGSLLAQASTEAKVSVALTVEPDLTGYASYYWRTDAESSFTEGNFVWNDDPYYTYVEIVSSIPAEPPVFEDVPANEYYYNAVQWAVEYGIAQGTSATTFRPNNPCTRAQVVTFLWRAAGSPDPESTTMPFMDVPKGIYYEKAVLWAVENGIAQGTSATTFRPNNPCTRAQIVTFLWRFQGKPSAGTSNPFTDVAESDYYTDAVLWAVENGITAGTSATTFRPNNPCTRAQTVTFLYRCLGK